MRVTPQTPPGTARRPPGDPDQLLERLGRALRSGLVSPGEIEALLARAERGAEGGSTAAAVLLALGSAVVFCGVAIAYGTVFADLPWAVRLTTPFLFPLVALTGCVALSHRGAPPWQRDLAGLIGFVAFAVASGASAATSGWVESGRDAAWAALAASAAGAAVATAVWRATGSRRLGWTGIPAALAALATAAAYLAGLWWTNVEGIVGLGWVVLAEAAAAAVLAATLARRDRAACRPPLVWAVAGAYGAVLFSGEDLTQASVWHAVLAGVVVAAFLAAAALDFDALTWIAAGGGAAWVLMIAVVVGSATGAALAVVLAGAGLLGLGVLVARIRRRAGPSAPRGDAS